MAEHMKLKLGCEKIIKKDEKGWTLSEKDGNAAWKYTNIKKKKKYEKNFSSPMSNFFKEVFLPQGYPDSVHPDYLPYQIWDTAQAFASTILGALTTHSVMRGVGVGESTATPLAAAVTWILKDGTGMIGRILFAWWNGPELDSQCKKWRLFADVLNDLAMGLELALPYFSNYSTIILCFSSGMKSLVGVAGGATRASITQHQALKNNLADVSAKDGSQETCVNLIASLVGVFMLSYLNASSYAAFWFVALASIHIYANHRAVRSLRFNTFNEDRLAILVEHYLKKSEILEPEVTNERESLIIFHKASKKLCGFDISIGGSMDRLFESGNFREEITSGLSNSLKSNNSNNCILIDGKMTLNSRCVILPDIKDRKLYVGLYDDATSEDILNIYFKAFLRAIFLSLCLNFNSVRRDAEDTSGLLSRLNKMAEEFKAEELKKMDSVEELIENENKKWKKLLEKSEWTTKTNLLPVGPYRLYEN